MCQLFEKLTLVGWGLLGKLSLLTNGKKEHLALVCLHILHSSGPIQEALCFVSKCSPSSRQEFSVVGTRQVLTGKETIRSATRQRKDQKQCLSIRGKAY